MVQVIVDMMAGIGPFAVPAAQRGCQVGSLKYCILAQSDSRLTEVAEEACLQTLTILDSGLGGPDALLPERLRSHWIYQDSKVSHEVNATQQGRLQDLEFRHAGVCQ